MIKMTTEGRNAMRSSNIELLRIVAMFFIVSHHFVINSGVMALYDASGINANTVFLQMWGMWGKTAINAFVLITGYFMCVSRLTLKRYLKLILEVYFYLVLTYVVMLSFSLVPFSALGAVQYFLSPVLNAGQSFVSSFLWFYLLIPYLNMLVERMDAHQHKVLLSILLGLFTIAGSLTFNAHLYNEVAWFSVIYLVGAFIRLHNYTWMNNNAVCFPLLTLSAALAVASVLIVDWCAMHGIFYTINSQYHLVESSNKLFAFSTGLLCFLVFKNLKIGYSRFINMMASTMFGVLCIHTMSNSIREFIWVRLFDVCGKFALPTVQLFIWAVFASMSIMFVGSIVDGLRIIMFERPLLSWMFNKSNRWNDRT